MEVCEANAIQHSELKKYSTSISLNVATEHSNAPEQFDFRLVDLEWHHFNPKDHRDLQCAPQVCIEKYYKNGNSKIMYRVSFI
jgi:hypothetical protein